MSIHLEIVTPLGIVMAGDVDAVVAPGFDGEFGALRGHHPYLVALKAGALHTVQGGQETWWAVSGGVAEVGLTRVVVLADRCEASSEIDAERAAKALKRAEKRLSGHADDADFDPDRAHAAAGRARARIGVSRQSR